jgi:hypothetical protein
VPEMLWYPSYRDEFSGGLYPFGDTATLVSDTRAIALAPGMLIDAAVYPVGGGPNARIASVIAEAAQVTFIVGDDTNPATCSTSFDPLAPPPLLLLLDPLGRPAGVLVVDPTAMAAAQTWPLGTYTFRSPSAGFAARCCFPSPAAGVNALIVNDTPVAGETWLIGDDGVILTAADDGIRMDIVGDPLSARRAGEALGEFATPRFVRTLRIDDGSGNFVDVTPDENGDIQLIVGDAAAADTALRVAPQSGAIIVKVVGSSLSG